MVQAVGWLNCIIFQKGTTSTVQVVDSIVSPSRAPFLPHPPPPPPPPSQIRDSVSVKFVLNRYLFPWCCISRSYDFMGRGDFVLYRNTERNFEVRNTFSHVANLHLLTFLKPRSDLRHGPRALKWMLFRHAIALTRVCSQTTLKRLTMVKSAN